MNNFYFKITPLIVFLSVVFTSNIQALMIKLNNEELALASSGVFIAKVAAVESYWNDERNFIYTRVRFNISGKLKGADDFYPDEIVIPGGKVGDWELRVADMPRFSADEEMLIFVNTEKDGMPYIVGAKQGKRSLKRKKDNEFDGGSTVFVESIRAIIRSQGVK